MFYRKLEVQDLIKENKKDKEENKFILDLMNNNDSQLKLLEIKKNESFEEHISHTDVFIYIVKGEIELYFPLNDLCGCGICGYIEPDDKTETGNSYIIKKEQMFMFEKEVKHTLKALKDSILLIVKM